MAHILFADDEPRAIESAAAYLRRKGHRTVVVNSGEAALEQIRQELPDILVIDAMMPRVDGFLVIQELRCNLPGNGVDVVLLTNIAADGEPLRDWSMPIQSYVLREKDHQHMKWQVVLAIEQLLSKRS